VQEGITRVILSIDGVQRDYSGWIMVQSTSVFSGGSGGGGGGCGTTSLQPGEAMWPVLLVLGGMILLLVRRRFNFKCQNSNFK